MKESYLWILNIIDSVDHSFQIECCKTLVSLFRLKYTQEEEFGPLYDTLLKAIKVKGGLLKV